MHSPHSIFYQANQFIMPQTQLYDFFDYLAGQKLDIQQQKPLSQQIKITFKHIDSIPKKLYQNRKFGDTNDKDQNFKPIFLRQVKPEMKDDIYPEFGVDSNNYEKRTNSKEKSQRVRNGYENQMEFQEGNSVIKERNMQNQKEIRQSSSQRQKQQMFKTFRTGMNSSTATARLGNLKTSTTTKSNPMNNTTRANHPSPLNSQFNNFNSSEKIIKQKHKNLNSLQPRISKSKQNNNQPTNDKNKAQIKSINNQKNNKIVPTSPRIFLRPLNQLHEQQQSQQNN